MERQREEFRDQRPRFFKVILPMPSACQHLRIPPEFVTHIERNIPRIATLRDPYGCCWPVKLCLGSEGTFLKDGWNQFFKAHSLGHYEFLIFTYDGRMCFDVRIYNKNGLERVGVHPNGDSSERATFEHDSGDEDEIKRECASENDGPGQDSQQRPRYESTKLKVFKDEKSRAKKEIMEEMIEISDDRFQTDPKIMQSKMLRGSCSQHHEKDDFHSEFPVFRRYIDSFTLRKIYYFRIPTRFAVEYLPDKKTRMTLICEQGRSWEVNFIPNGGSSPYFSGGWPFFLRDNELELGDLCVFELVKKTEMEVHIFRSSRIEAVEQ